MAYLSKRKNSPYWFANFIGANGKKTSRSTKQLVDAGKNSVRSMAQAQSMADALEDSQRDGRNALHLIEGLQQVVDASLGIEKKRMITVAEWLDSTYLSKEKLCAPGTMKCYKTAFSTFRDFLGDRVDMDIANLSKTDAVRYMEAMLTRVRSGTVERHLACLCSTFGQAWDQELISRNPFAKLAVPAQRASKDKSVREAFSISEIKLMLSRFSSEWCSMILCSLYLGGLRLGDTALLRWDSVDFDNRLVRLQTQKTTRHMIIPLVKPLEEHLLALRQDAKDEYVHPSMAYVSINKSASALSIEFSNAVKMLGISKPADAVKATDSRCMTNKSFHSLRATAVTMLHMAGVPQSIAMQIAGHSSQAIHDVYVKPSLEQVGKAMESLNLQPSEKTD